MDDREKLSSKTIFILDCSKKYRNTNSGQRYEIGVKVKPNESASSSTSSGATITKSLYTCSVEAIFEYSRIVWDLFPNGERLLHFICCSPGSTYSLNRWDIPEQNCDKLLNAFIKVTQSSAAAKHPDSQKENESKSFLLNGFRHALEQLSQRPNKTPTGDEIFGRIILVTHAVGNRFTDNFKDELLKEFCAYNKNFEFTVNKEGSISLLDVILINTHPIGSENVLPDVPEQKLSNRLKFAVQSVPSSSILAARLTCMAFDHHDLASTTVINIPMKEEQNSGSSANYDVEIIHSRKAHNQLCQFTNQADMNSLYLDVDREQQKYKSLKLKWCTPKNNALDSIYCTGAYRITAVDVSSRPTSCLINFLHTGKTVILEIPGNRMISHMLRCHNGELFIHVLKHSFPALIEDAPSISEGVGGRTTDYRINDFAELMKRNHLTWRPGLAAAAAADADPDFDGLEQADQLLKKQTMYWPISFGLTVFFNIRDQLQHFYQLISKEKLADSEMIELKNTIFNFITSESNGFPLPVQSNIIRSKGLKKEDMYRILWNEMEHIMRCHNVSPQHRSVLQCFLDCRPKNDGNYPLLMIQNPHHQQYPLHHGGGESKMATTATRTVANGESIINGNRHHHHTTQSVNMNRIKPSQESLMDMFLTKLETKRKRPDFVGRGNQKIAKLYVGLLNEDK